MMAMVVTESMMTLPKAVFGAAVAVGDDADGEAM
jgi:hypothetical protein